MRELLNQVVAIILTAVAGVIAVYSSTFAHAASTWMRAKAKGTRWEWIVGAVSAAAPVVVAQVQATVRAAYERANSDGKITPEEGRALLQAAIDALKVQMGPDALAALRASVGPQVDTWLAAQVEAELVRLKERTSFPPAAATNGASRAAH